MDGQNITNFIEINGYKYPVYKVIEQGVLPSLIYYFDSQDLRTKTTISSMVKFV